MRRESVNCQNNFIYNKKYFDKWALRILRQWGWAYYSRFPSDKGKIGLHRIKIEGIGLNRWNWISQVPKKKEKRDQSTISIKLHGAMLQFSLLFPIQCFSVQFPRIHKWDNPTSTLVLWFMSLQSAKEIWEGSSFRILHYLEAQPHFYVTKTEAIVRKDLCYLDITENHVLNKKQKRIQVTSPNWLTLKARFDLVKDRENSLCGSYLYHQIT